MTSVRRSALVPFSTREMYQLVADIPSYPRFLPWCAGARILSRSEDEVVASIDIAYHGLHKTFTTRNLLQQDKMMELRLLEGPFKYLHGYWQFDALEELASRITLDLEFEGASRLLGFVLEQVFGTIAGEMVDSFHRRAVQLYGRRP